MIYAVSDIHGNKEAWESIKELIHFSEEDEMYILGDVIDRGIHGIEILIEIMNTPNMHMILGNHEYMMINALRYGEYDVWFRNGGFPTYQSYNQFSSNTQKKIIDFIESLDLQETINIGNNEIILCHANSINAYHNIMQMYNDRFSNNIFNQDELINFCVWDREYMRNISLFIDLQINQWIIHGHTPTIHDSKNGVYEMGYVEMHSYHVLNIDCGSGYPEFNGRLACVDLEGLVNIDIDTQVFYSNDKVKGV